MNNQAMPIKAKPYEHQMKAFSFVCGRFELDGKLEGGVTPISAIEKATNSAALLMEM